MSEFTTNCPNCRQSLSGPEEMLGLTIDCPACKRSFQLPARKAPVVVKRTRKAREADPAAGGPEAATAKQIAFIRALGGAPDASLTKEAASSLIDRLKQTAPPTRRQTEALKRLGATIPKSLTYEQSIELLSQLDGKSPPMEHQIQFIKMLGGVVPRTKSEASELCARLPDTAPATAEQRNRAIEMGATLPPTATYAQADAVFGDLEMDADEKEGKLPTQAQLSKIAKLGGEPTRAKNRWRADAYIEELECQQEEFNDRVENASIFMFSEKSRAFPSVVRKPSRAIMAKAIRYGDAQGWGEGWDDDEDRVDAAVYAVAPELLKKNALPPGSRRQATAARSPKGKGCLLPFVFMAVSGMTFVVVFMLR